MYQLNQINKAFSSKSRIYDAYSKKNIIVKIARRKVYKNIQRNLKKEDKILELNSGTGLDALFFASQGYFVHATDIADGMVAKIKTKIKKSGLHNFTVQQLDFSQIQSVENGPFDYIFSNFGGINCTPDIQKFCDSIDDSILKPNGFITLVILPPICPWELLNFPWSFKTAFRRLPSIRGKGVQSNIDGIEFVTYYYSVNTILQIFETNFERISLESVSCFSPPSFMDFFPKRYPKLFKFLVKLDNKFSSSFPFNQIGDFYILTLQHNPI